MGFLDIASVNFSVIVVFNGIAPPNGLTQRQRRDRRDSFLIIAHFWQSAYESQRRSRQVEAHVRRPTRQQVARAARPQTRRRCPAVGFMQG